MRGQQVTGLRPPADGDQSAAERSPEAASQEDPLPSIQPLFPEERFFGQREVEHQAVAVAIFENPGHAGLAPLGNRQRG